MLPGMHQRPVYANLFVGYIFDGQQNSKIFFFKIEKLQQYRNKIQVLPKDYEPEKVKL